MSTLKWTSPHSIYLAGVKLVAGWEPIVLLGLRLLVARVFWNSGLAKVETFDLFGLRLPTWNIQNSTFFLFEHQFFPGMPEWFSDTAAIMATIGELTLPLLLVFGAFTRLGALGLIAMTAVIQIFVLPGEWWSVHAWWAACLAVLLVRGGGCFSVDRYTGFERAREG